MINEEKLNDRLTLYYEALAQEDTLTEKEKAKLYKDIDREIAEARKMQLRTHVVCAIAMISSIASIVLTIILE